MNTCIYDALGRGVMGARRHGQDKRVAIPLKMYKARFASITTFWFAQKETKSWLQDTFYRGSSSDPAGGVYSAPQTYSCI